MVYCFSAVVIIFCGMLPQTWNPSTAIRFLPALEINDDRVNDTSPQRTITASPISISTHSIFDTFMTVPLFECNAPRAARRDDPRPLSHGGDGVTEVAQQPGTPGRCAAWYHRQKKMNAISILFLPARPCASVTSATPRLSRG